MNKMRWLFLSAFVLINLLAFPLHAQQVKRKISFVDMLWRIVDLRNLPLIEEGVKCAQFSSYDRASKSPDEPNWGANKDWGNYLRIEENGEAVMAEIEGGGCIVRIWSANPQGKIRFYLDDAEKPFEFEFQQLFKGDFEPFLSPLCGYHGRGANCYLPIPFAKRCKVTADKPHGQYYHITYVTFPKDWQIETFRLPLTEEEIEALKRVIEVLKRSGENPHPQDVKVERITGKLKLAPSQRHAIAQLAGPGIIRSLRFKVESNEMLVYRRLVIMAFWDDEKEPSIWCPIGDFFGCGFGFREYTSLPMGVTGEGAYCYFPMPFKKGARIELLNEGKAEVVVEFSIECERDVQLPETIGYFHAKWRREAPCKTFDYPFLEAKGVGKYVGTSLSIDNPEPGWWGEGDEKVWIDGEAFPSIFGTGSEDYFGDAWGFRPFIHPLHGCILRERPDHAGKTSVYRWHIADAIPFYKSIRFTIENYDTDKDYTSVAYWYQVEPHSDFFKPVEVSQRLPIPKRIIGAVELEDVKVEAKEGIKIVSGEETRVELSGDRAILFAPSKETNEFALLIPIKQEDVYELILHSAMGLEQPAFKVLVDGKAVGEFQKPFADSPMLRLGRVRMRPPISRLQIVVQELEVKEKHLLLDALELRQSPKVRRAIEAEGLPVKSSDGVKVNIEDGRMEWSGWAQLHIASDGANRWVELQLPKELKGKFILNARMTNSSKGGIVRFNFSGKALGEPINCYADTERLGSEIQLGSVELTGGEANLLRCEIVGKDERSGGFEVGIDYIRLVRVLVEGAIEAEQLKILKFERCRPVIQNMSPWGAERWSNENQLFCPGELNSNVVLEFEVGERRNYELDIYFTKAPDYGIVEVLVDGKVVGKPFDGYSPTVEPSGKVNFGIIELSEGKHTIEFRTIGKNEKSTNYFMGIDCITLTPK